MTATVLCVLRSGGIYDAEWVRRLRDGVARHLTLPHRFACLSDVDVPCERIPLEHNWPGWWSKIELFRPRVVTGPTLYLDLDTIIVGNIDRLFRLPFDFAMLRGFGRKHFVGSGVMWFGKPQHHVYDRFAEKPDHWIDYHEKAAHQAYIGDQAFIWDSFNGDVHRLTDALPGVVVLYQKHCVNGLPKGASVVCFKGDVKPHNVTAPWVRRAWA